MNPDEKKLLQETAAIAKENNKILHQLRRSLVWGRVLRTVYWVLIIGASIGAFYFLQPYIETLKDIYGGAQDAQSNLWKIFGF